MKLSLDAEALVVQLRDGVRGLLAPDTRLVGIWSGGAWLAQRLQADLGRPGAAGTVSSRAHLTALTQSVVPLPVHRSASNPYHLVSSARTTSLY